MLNPTETSPFGALNKIFHEPSRLALLSALCGATHGMTFSELKRDCRLTDGNLSRHLKTLEEARVVTVRKSFQGATPRTVVRISDFGRESFIRYLEALEQVLVTASEAVEREKSADDGLFPPLWDGFQPLEPAP